MQPQEWPVLFAFPACWAPEWHTAIRTNGLGCTEHGPFCLLLPEMKSLCSEDDDCEEAALLGIAVLILCGWIWFRSPTGHQHKSALGCQEGLDQRPGWASEDTPDTLHQLSFISYSEYNIYMMAFKAIKLWPSQGNPPTVEVPRTWCALADEHPNGFFHHHRRVAVVFDPDSHPNQRHRKAKVYFCSPATSPCAPGTPQLPEAAPALPRKCWAFTHTLPRGQMYSWNANYT